MKQNEIFLKLYREYETILRERDIDPKDYEDSSSDLIGGRLRMCRLFRNYLSHNNDSGFLAISDSQVKFLNQQINELKHSDDIVKKHIKAVANTVVGENDKCQDVLKKAAKLKTDKLVIITAKGIKTISVFDIMEPGLSSKTAKLSGIKTDKDFVLVEKTMKMSDVPADRIVVCTEDGTDKTAVLGVIYPKQ